MEKRIVIFGAGKIGRGYLADLFGDEGFHLVFVDADEQLVDRLSAAGSYKLFTTTTSGEVFEKTVSGFDVLANVRDYEQVIEELVRCGLAAAAVFPDALSDIARVLADAVTRRAHGARGFFNLILFVNKPFIGRSLRTRVQSLLDSKALAYFDEQVGIVEAITVRGGMRPTDEMLAEDPLCVSTSEGRVFKVGDTFKGGRPTISCMEFLDNMEGQLAKKVWCGNMLHCTLAALGAPRGYTKNIECNRDPAIRAFVEQAFDEASFAVAQEFSFDSDAMEENRRHYWRVMMDSDVEDDVSRMAHDPIRKLGRHDRFIGPAMACLEHGRLPYFLAKAAAYLLRYEDPGDVSSVQMQERINSEGIEATVADICGLGDEDAGERLLRQLVCGAYRELSIMSHEEK